MSGDDNGRFEEFMAPVGNVLNLIRHALETQETPGAEARVSSPRLRANTQTSARALTPAQSASQNAMLGVVRDLRGITQSCTDKAKYILLFDWIYPEYMPVLTRALEVWYADHKLSVPILKFMVSASAISR